MVGALRFLQACICAFSRISNNLKDLLIDVRMRAMICVLAHAARAVKMLSLRCCDWQAHFLGLRVQKNISRLTLITSHSSLANSAHLLRVIGFSHLFLKVSKCPFSPWYTFPGLKSSSLRASEASARALQPPPPRRARSGPGSPATKATCPALQRSENQRERVHSSSSCHTRVPGE